MKKNIFLKGLTLTLAGAMAAASLLANAENLKYEYPTKVIKLYDHNGNLINSHMAPDVQYIEVEDLMVEPKVFTVNGTDGAVKFKMIPVLGTNSYKLKSSAIQWPESEKTAPVESFFIGETEVTNALWKAVMGSLPSSMQATDDEYPVACISWNEICQTGGFLDKLNEKVASQPGMAELMADYEFALPGEWEWEYAACGGNNWDTFKYSGSNDATEVACFNYSSATENPPIFPVATKSPNSLGIYDMSGNVWEFCAENQYKHSDGRILTGRRVQRGGSFGTKNITVDARDANNTPTYTLNALGFRLALKKKALKPETYTVTGADGTSVNFTMIPVIGSHSYGLKSSLINWPSEHDKYKAVGTFYMGETEVTNALWKAVIGSVPSTSNTGDNYPVETVSWEEICQEGGFLDKLNALVQSDSRLKAMVNGRKFCLPNEWEWEYAAAGGHFNNSFTYSGSNEADKVGWFSNTGSEGHSHEVATKDPNKLGIYDMSGNVWEWCADNPYIDNDGATKEQRRPQRGSCFNTAASSYIVRTANNAPGFAADNLGFRLILK